MDTVKTRNELSQTQSQAEGYRRLLLIGGPNSERFSEAIRNGSLARLDGLTSRLSARLTDKLKSFSNCSSVGLAGAG